jgi:hypothetical protein
MRRIEQVSIDELVRRDPVRRDDTKVRVVLKLNTLFNYIISLIRGR